MLRLLFALALTATALGLARPAHALPEPYVGIGAFGSKDGDSSLFAAELEGGVDAIYSGLGVGARVELPLSFKPGLTAELRYTIIKLPFVRLLGGVGGGVVKGDDPVKSDWAGTANAFVSGRVSLGLPYVAVRLGVAVPNGVSLFGTLTFGISL